MPSTPFVIADVGSNWRRYADRKKNLDCAIQHIEEAAACGVSAVKFQLFTHEELYGFPGDDTYALPPLWVPELAYHCAERGVEFMGTAFSAKGVGIVDPYVKRHKIASAEMLHTGILDAVIATGKPFIVSTGGASQSELWAVNKCIADRGNIPSDHWAVLECVASYPADPAAYNLLWLCGMGGPKGISDHTLSLVVALTAVGCGATIFEKHFIASFQPFEDDIADPSPDEPHSIGPEQMALYVTAIKEAFSAMGDGVKKPHPSEAEFVRTARRAPGADTFRRKP